MILYGAQLILNAMWTWLFFSWHTGAGAFADIIVLWLLIAATIVGFWRSHKIAGALLLPYIAWVSFATALTWSVWQMNRPGTRTPKGSNASQFAIPAVEWQTRR